MGCGSSVERVRVAVDADEAWTPRRVNFVFGHEATKSLHSRFGPNRRGKRRVNFFWAGFLATFFRQSGRQARFSQTAGKAGNGGASARAHSDAAAGAGAYQSVVVLLLMVMVMLATRGKRERRRREETGGWMSRMRTTTTAMTTNTRTTSTTNSKTTTQSIATTTAAKTSRRAFSPRQARQRQQQRGTNKDRPHQCEFYCTCASLHTTKQM